MERSSVLPPELQSLTWITLIFISLNFCFAQGDNREAIDNLWTETIEVFLNDPIWQQRDAYDATHFLMPALHYAFYTNDESKIKNFDDMVARLEVIGLNDALNKMDDRLTRLHFLYLISQYLVLRKENGYIVAEHLLEELTNQLIEIWQLPAWHWSICGVDQFPNMQSRIEWKLSHHSSEISYCRAIIDEELFGLAIGLDIKYLYGKEASEVINNMVEVAISILSQFEYINDSFSFQPNVWVEHPDYQYAGWTEKRAGLHPKPKQSLASDTSHSARWPLFLQSFERSLLDGDALTIELIRQNLTDSFIANVLVPPTSEFPNYRTMNFMDGYNGLYRYNYPTQPNNAYGPYELSGTFLIGWWAFLNNESINNAYCFISESYPLDVQEIALYLGPDTTRERHPLIMGESQFQSGILELNSRLACAMKGSK